jgi:hypothetical protein
MGYIWKVGNGKKICFWEDNWLGPSSLAIQYWDLYRLVNEKNKTIAKLWDGENLKCTFRRIVHDRLLLMWEEVFQLASTLSLNDSENALIWKLSSNGVYSVQYLYKVTNFRGIQPVLVSSIWDIKIPPRVQYFLWLLSKNKLLTRDNVGKRRKVDYEWCLFCDEKESVPHLFFDCAVVNSYGVVFLKSSMFN